MTIANALPTLERGIFLDGWSLDAEMKHVSNSTEFDKRVYERVKNHHPHVPSITTDVFWLWQNELPKNKSDAIRSVLPEPLAALWDGN